MINHATSERIAISKIQNKKVSEIFINIVLLLELFVTVLAKNLNQNKNSQLIY